MPTPLPKNSTRLKRRRPFQMKGPFLYFNYLKTLLIYYVKYAMLSTMNKNHNRVWLLTGVALATFAVSYISTVQLSDSVQASMAYTCPAECDGADCPHAK